MSYPVGTICIGQNYKLDTQFNGMECVITGGIQLRPWVGRRGESGKSLCYAVAWANGEETVERHHNLKRKDWHDEEKRAEDRTKVRNLYDALEKAAESAIEAGEKVDQEEGAE